MKHNSGPNREPSQNAWKHGLSVPPKRDPRLSAQASALAGAISGDFPTAARDRLRPLALELAEAILDLQRIRAHATEIRLRTLAALASGAPTCTALELQATQLRRLERYFFGE